MGTRAAVVGVTSLDKKDLRRKQILDAAFESFIRHGYSKVTINDIAIEAEISRPLIYLLFKSKEDIFINMFEDLFDAQEERVRTVMASDLPARDKLIETFNIVILEFWPKLSDSPEGNDLFDATNKLFPRIGNKYRKPLIAMMGKIIGDESAELLILAVKGLYYDRPSTALLRKRISLLVDKFL